MDQTAPSSAATSGAETDATETAMTSQSTEIQWFIARDGKQYGPLSDLEMQKLVELGHLRPVDLVWRPGFPDWRPAASLMPKPAAAAPAAPAPEPQAAATHAQPQRQPHSQNQPQAYGEPHSPAPAQQPRPQATQPTQHTQPTQPAAATPTLAQPAQQRGEVTTGGRPASSTAGRMPTGGGAGATPQSGGHAASPAGGMPAMGGRSPSQPLQPASPQPHPYAIGGIPTQTTQAHQTGPHAGAPMPQPGAAQASAPGQQPAGPSLSTASHSTAGGRRNVSAGGTKLPDVSIEPRVPTPGRKRSMAAAAIVLLVAAGAGFMLSRKGTLPGVNVTTADATAQLAPLVTFSDSPETLDANFQRTPLWVVVKREFPDWYGERLKEVAKLTSEKQPEDAVAKRLTEALVALRRQNADKALAASTARLKGVATAFLENLKALAAKSTDACYTFISQGESSPAIIEMMRSPELNAPVQTQVAAIFEAIAEGRKSPVAHSAPVKSDYDALADQLTRLGWTQADLQLFADSKSLAKAKPEKVCRMVQDWFVAHIGISDAAVQERLLVETLRPVVAG